MFSVMLCCFIVFFFLASSVIYRYKGDLPNWASHQARMYKIFFRVSTENGKAFVNHLVEAIGDLTNLSI